MQATTAARPVIRPGRYKIEIPGSDDACYRQFSRVMRRLCDHAERGKRLWERKEQADHMLYKAKQLEHKGLHGISYATVKRLHNESERLRNQHWQLTEDGERREIGLVRRFADVMGYKWDRRYHELAQDHFRQIVEQRHGLDSYDRISNELVVSDPDAAAYWLHGTLLMYLRRNYGETVTLPTKPDQATA